MKEFRKKETLVPPHFFNYFLHGFVLLVVSYLVFLSQVTPFTWHFSYFIVFSVLFSIVLLTIMGILNMVIAESVWSLNVKSNLGDWIIQGFIVVLPTQILLIPFYYMINMILSSLSNLIIAFLEFILLFFGYTFIFGYIGLKAAGMYTEGETYQRKRGKHQQETFTDTRARCTFCGESYRYPLSEISHEGIVRCLNCGRTFSIEPNEELLKKLRKFQE